MSSVHKIGDYGIGTTKFSSIVLVESEKEKVYLEAIQKKLSDAKLSHVQRNGVLIETFLTRARKGPPNFFLPTTVKDIQHATVCIETTFKGVVCTEQDELLASATEQDFINARAVDMLLAMFLDYGISQKNTLDILDNRVGICIYTAHDKKWIVVSSVATGWLESKTNEELIFPDIPQDIHGILALSQDPRGNHFTVLFSTDKHFNKWEVRDSYHVNPALETETKFANLLRKSVLTAMGRQVPTSRGVSVSLNTQHNLIRQGTNDCGFCAIMYVVYRLGIIKLVDYTREMSHHLRRSSLWLILMANPKNIFVTIYKRVPENPKRGAWFEFNEEGPSSSMIIDEHIPVRCTLLANEVAAYLALPQTGTIRERMDKAFTTCTKKVGVDLT